MSGHLDGTYGVVGLRGESSAYFVTEAEAAALARFLDGRDSQSREDRADFVLITELSGERFRIAVDVIEHVKVSTPESRKLNNEISSELKARNLASGDD